MLAPRVNPETGATVLYDIFVSGKWVGSRRTIPYAIDELRRQGWPSAVLALAYRIEQGSPAKIIFEV